MKTYQTCQKCTIEAPCKINLHLKIGEKRPDGFHELESLFASLSHGDSLQFECDGREGDCKLFVKWEVPGIKVPGNIIPVEKNLVLRAVSLFREQTGFDMSLRIKLVKRVPVGSGLGGGSSDAASALLALNSLAKTDLPIEKLKEMALQLGSDVPFFLYGGAAFVSGRGEHIEPITPPDEELCVMLVKPPFFSSTASAFRLLDRFREGGDAAGKGPAGIVETKLASLEGDPARWNFFNDFLPVFLADDSVNGRTYQHILETLKSSGASFAGLSGAGSCCFGIFKNKKAAKLAGKNQNDKGNFVRYAFFLAHKPKPVVEY